MHTSGKILATPLSMHLYVCISWLLILNTNQNSNHQMISITKQGASYSVKCLKTFQCSFGVVLPMSVKCGFSLSLRSVQWLFLDDVCSQLVWVVQLSLRCGLYSCGLCSGFLGYCQQCFLADGWGGLTWVNSWWDHRSHRCVPLLILYISGVVCSE